MKSRFVFVFLVTILLGASCARIVDVVDRPPSPEVKLFESAERKFAASEYDEALVLYEQYIHEHPEAAMVPAAMLKIGMIRMETKKYEEARQMYEKLLEDFPGTHFAMEAHVEIISSYLQEGRYDEVFDYAEKLDRKRFPPDMRMRISFAVGDAYMIKKEYEHAFAVFMEAFADALETRRMHAGWRLMDVASYMDTDELKAIIAGLDGEEPAGYLLYQKALSLVDEGRTGEAIAVLQDFSKKFPDHVLLQKALEKKEELEALAHFEGHRIGVLMPLSGEYETFGRKALRGIEMALIQYSSRENTDPPIEIVVWDTGGDTGQVEEGVRQLAKENVAAIVGPIVMAGKAAGEAQKNRIPIITLSQTADITEAGDYVFCNFLTPKMQMEALVAYTTGKLGLRKFAVLYPDETYGETFLHLFWDKLIENDSIVAGVEKYDPEKTDFSDPIKKLVGLYYDVPDELKSLVPVDGQLFDADVDSYGDDVPELVEVVEESRSGNDKEEEQKAIVDFDAVFIPDSPRVAGLIIPQLRYYDITGVYLLGTHLWHSERLIETAGRQLRQIIIPEGFFAQSRRPHVARFVDGFQEIYGESPGIIEASGYDSGMILFDLITKPEIDNRVDLKNALLDMPPFTGVTGETRFDETGDAVKNLYLLEVSRGRFLEISEQGSTY